FLIFSLVFEFISRTKKFWKWFLIIAFIIHGFLFVFPNTLLLFDNNKTSQTKGSVSRGSIEHAKRVPMRGANYTTYSFWGYLFARTFTHDKVKQTILDAYQTCESTCPNTKFLLGEIGFPNGGKFLPHRTHRNGMSVDFMSPLKKGEKHLGTGYHRYNALNLWGYGMEFDKEGKDGKRELDFETIALHLQALEKSAKKNGLSIQKVILHPDLRNKLLRTKEGKKIRHLPFTKNPVILRHDDHYHVDFKLR
ncbi:MAG: penicillin-insensitive murein endopeptidase, partial [Saprospiraceae bacterium]